MAVPPTVPVIVLAAEGASSNEKKLVPPIATGTMKLTRPALAVLEMFEKYALEAAIAGRVDDVTGKTIPVDAISVEAEQVRRPT